MPKPSHKRFLPQMAPIDADAALEKSEKICVIGGLNRDHLASPFRPNAPEDWRRPKAGALTRAWVNA